MSHTFGENDLYGYDGQDRVLSSINPGTVLGAIEVLHNDGPWNPPENFRKLNFRLGYSQGSAEDGFSVAVNGYSGAWTGEQQLAERRFATTWLTISVTWIPRTEVIASATC
jgi:hypothetical protein